MQIITIFTEQDQKSYFKPLEMGGHLKQPLSEYSKKYPVTGLIFREFKAGAVFDFHPSPQPQYVIYLHGEVEIEASGGDKRVFKAGDILFANDVTGKGHITRAITDGTSIVITTVEETHEQKKLEFKL